MTFDEEKITEKQDLPFIGGGGYPHLSNAGVPYTSSSKETEEIDTFFVKK